VSASYEYDDVTTPSGYLKQYVFSETSNWVMVVLEQAGVVELDRRRPIEASVASRPLDAFAHTRTSVAVPGICGRTSR
jgi:hypothetical protein